MKKQLRDFNLRGLHRWLKSQNAGRTYVRGSIHDCLLAAFAKPRFGNTAWVGPSVLIGDRAWAIRFTNGDGQVTVSAAWLTKVGEWFDGSDVPVRTAELLVAFERHFVVELGLKPANSTTISTPLDLDNIHF